VINGEVTGSEPQAQAAQQVQQPDANPLRHGDGLPLICVVIDTGALLIEHGPAMVGLNQLLAGEGCMTDLAR
jgi:hypothetical protein